MPLNVTLSRDPRKVELGAFDKLALTEDALRVPGSDARVARHIHHRWHAEPYGESFPRIDIAGPLTVCLESGEGARALGPYLHFHVINGVAYVDHRIFGFFDLERHDWYVVDEGMHSKAMTIAAHHAKE